MSSSRKRLLGAVLVSVMTAVCACQNKYERLPQASASVFQALKERYLALVEEAKKLQGGDPFELLHHFSNAALTATPPAEFTAKAQAFIERASSGALDKVKITGTRAPGKVRLLLVDDGENSGAIPFVQGADGWAIDDVAIAFGQLDKEINLQGNMPVSPPSPLAALAQLRDPQAAESDQVQAALALAEAKQKEIAGKYAGKAKGPWARTALLYAVWKSGGDCQAFAKAFPADGSAQDKLYQADSDAFRTLLQGLCQCAADSGNFRPALKVYRACRDAPAQPRSEYVDPLVKLANAKPAYILQAALRAGIAYDEDPAAHIVVGALHGEKKTAFHQYLHQQAKKGGRLGKLAADWVERMAKLDEEEPPEATGQKEQPAQ